MNTPDMKTTAHEGRNVKRIREMLGMKQEALALELGNDWTQRRISLLEQKEEIEPAILEEVAKALHVTPEAIKNFTEDAAVNIIQQNYAGATNNHNIENFNYQCTINPFEKIMQLYDEKIALYERMLKDREEMMEMMRKK